MYTDTIAIVVDIHILQSPLFITRAPRCTANNARFEDLVRWVLILHIV